MSDTDKSAKKPDLVAYHVLDRGEDKKSHWTEIGGAWRHRDGKGLNIELNSFPKDGRITLRDYVDRAIEQRDPSPEQNQGPAHDPTHVPER